MGKRRKKDWWKGGAGTGSAYTGKAYVACAATHPPLTFKAKDGKEYSIYGGSCLTPYVEDADVYVGLDAGMPRTEKAWPWTPGIEVFYKITDMSIPTDAEAFKLLISWIISRVKAGDKVHVGCIGGHGRTGMVLAAVYSVMTGRKKNAIQEVREKYCDSAVESSEQVAFLTKHFGIGHAEGAKADWYGGYGAYGGYGGYSTPGKATTTTGTGAPAKLQLDAAPLKCRTNIWGDWSLVDDIIE